MQPNRVIKVKTIGSQPMPHASIGLQIAFFWKELLMGILSWIILGLIAGFIGSKIVNSSGSGWIMDIVLGIVGAVVGGAIFNFFGAQGVTGLNIYSMIVAVVGAIVVIYAYHAITGRRSL